MIIYEVLSQVIKLVSTLTKDKQWYRLGKYLIKEGNDRHLWIIRTVVCIYVLKKFIVGKSLVHSKCES